MHTPNCYAQKNQKQRKNKKKEAAFEILLRGAPLVAQRLCDLACAQLDAVASATSFPFRKTRGPVIYANPNRFGSRVFVRLGGIDRNRSRLRKPLLPVIYVKKSVRVLGHDSGY